MNNFESFKLPEFLNNSLKKMNIKQPTPIQEKAIPWALEGTDILANAPTGTGKTIAYLLPLLTKLNENNDTTALILVPTRELAAQIQVAARTLANNTMGVTLLIGGESIFKQILALRKKPRIVIGTPGRIIDHLRRKTLNLTPTKFLVLDETDRMLDMGFTEDLQHIVQKLPEVRQTLMFSATIPPSIKTLSSTYLKNPQHISVGSTTQPVQKIKQETLEIKSSDKFTCLIKELDNRQGSVIIFVKTKHSADRLADKLTEKKHEADAIHGDLKQRKRDQVIKNFRNLKKRIMVATDVAARGLDIPHIMHVINYDLPQCPEDYIHRIGRTGRAGMEGFALSFISPDETHKWKRIYNLIHLGKSEETSFSNKKPSRKRRKPFANKQANEQQPKKSRKPNESKNWNPKEKPFKKKRRNESQSKDSPFNRQKSFKKRAKG
jgi:superfamily II DNA/RNA helicase